MFDTETGSVSEAFAKNGAVDNAFTSAAMTAYFFQCTDKFYENLRLLQSRSMASPPSLGRMASASAAT